jgi:hypothetical protein
MAKPIRHRIVGEMVTNGLEVTRGQSNLEFQACFSTAQSLDRAQQNVFALTS